ncbi:hypothetical protein ACLOJK_033538 [Asimina triloba]
MGRFGANVVSKSIIAALPPISFATVNLALPSPPRCLDASRLLYPATADPVLPPVSSSTANPALPPVSSVTHLLTCQRDPITADGNNPFLCL